MDMIRRNSNSPFRLQRSIVNQGDENGAYSKGGYNPDAVAYNGETMNSVIESSGATLGAALSALGSNDQSDRMRKKKERLTKRRDILVSKEKVEGISSTQKERLKNRIGRVGERLKNVTTKLDAYNESNKPKITSSIDNKYDAKEVKKEEVKSTEEDNKPKTFFFNKNYYLKNKYNAGS